MNDIQYISDIELLVNTFYEKVRHDDYIGFIFNDVMQVNWEHHLPIMYDFWASVLFGNATYKGNPMLKHIAIDQKIRLTPAHFERWLSLFEATLNQLFEGPMKEEAYKRASSIQGLMLYKVEQARF